MSHERPLQELSCLSQNYEGSMLVAPSKCSKRKKGCFAEGLDTENTPNELISQWSPPHKHSRVITKGKENEENQFVLARRSRRRKDSTSGFSWDSLPEELFLRIFFCLPLQDLLRMSRVCKRWHRLTRDESLWLSVDLVGLTHTSPALQQALGLGVRRLRCPRALIEELRFPDATPLHVQQMDLSNCTITTSALEEVASRCTLLQHLSLEGLQLSDSIIQSLARNQDLMQLNLCGCSGVSPDSLSEMLKSLSRLEQLNISWCDFTNSHVKAIVSSLSASVRGLNLSGYRQNLTLEDVKTLVERCPSITVLDLSDSVLLTTDSFPILEQLEALSHLSLSRCYQIHAAALADFNEKFPALKQLDVFGLVQDGHLRTLKKGLPRISVNARPFSAVARPTPALHWDEHVMWRARCRLRFKS